MGLFQSASKVPTVSSDWFRKPRWEIILALLPHLSYARLRCQSPTGRSSSIGLQPKLATWLSCVHTTMQPHLQLRRVRHTCHNHCDQSKPASLIVNQKTLGKFFKSHAGSIQAKILNGFPTVSSPWIPHSSCVQECLGCPQKKKTDSLKYFHPCFRTVWPATSCWHCSSPTSLASTRAHEHLNSALCQIEKNHLHCLFVLVAAFVSSCCITSSSSADISTLKQVLGTLQSGSW